MTKQLGVALAVIALVGACEKRGADTGAIDNDRSGVDTTIQSGTIKDTTVVQADTSIDVDTLKQTDNMEKKDS